MLTKTLTLHGFCSGRRSCLRIHAVSHIFCQQVYYPEIFSKKKKPRLALFLPVLHGRQTLWCCYFLCRGYRKHTPTVGEGRIVLGLEFWAEKHSSCNRGKWQEYFIYFVFFVFHFLFYSGIILFCLSFTYNHFCHRTRFAASFKCGDFILTFNDSHVQQVRELFPKVQPIGCVANFCEFRVFLFKHGEHFLIIKLWRKIFHFLPRVVACIGCEGRDMFKYLSFDIARKTIICVFASFVFSNLAIYLQVS